MATVTELTSTGYGKGLEARWMGPQRETGKRTPPWPNPQGIEAMVACTKLRRPQLPTDMVERPRLLSALDQGLERPVTLISAPAGYGKTTLLSNWVESCPLPNAWVSLGDEDNGLAPFLGYFLAALRSMFPSAMRRTLAFLESGMLPSPKALSVALLNDLDELDEKFVLVLDGVEVLKDPSVRELLTALLQNPPLAMNLVMAGRRDPFLPIAALRTTIQIAEIRAKDLKFRVDETLELLEKACPLMARPRTAGAWTEATEGWITGLRLALQETGGALGPDLKRRALTRHVRQYLKYEVLERQPTQVRRFLLQVSILDRLCGPLCDFLNEKVGGKSQMPKRGAGALGLLQDQGLFLVPLDSEDRWFRLHGLVREFLITHRELEEKPGSDGPLHALASQWFAENGHLEDAVRHAVAAGDLSGAEELVIQNLQELMDEEAWDRIRTILGHLPQDRVEGRPDLLLARAWTTFHRCHNSETEATLDRVEVLVGSKKRTASEKKALKGEIHCLRSSLCTVQADPEGAIMHGSAALEKLPESSIFQRGAALTNLSGGYWSQGDTAKAEEVLESALVGMSCQTARARARILVAICFLHWAKGDLEALDQATARCLHHAEECVFPQAGATAQFLSGLSSYQRNNLPVAEAQLLAAREQIMLLPQVQAQGILQALSLVYQAQGRHAEAIEVISSLTDGGPRDPAKDIGESPLTLRADLAYRQGNRAEALELVGSLDLDSGHPKQVAIHPWLTLAKTLVALGDADSLEEAERVLDHLDGSDGLAGSASLRIEGLCVKALLHDMRDEEEAASEIISQALALAEPGRFVRAFVDMGQAMASLLKPLARQDQHGDFARDILTDYYEDSMASGGWNTKPSGSGSSSRGNPAETLTRKEMEALQLLAQGLYNREIADRLFVSVETVKTHLKHIYRKLNVGTRRQAVTRAKAMGVLGDRRQPEVGLELAAS